MNHRPVGKNWRWDIGWGLALLIAAWGLWSLNLGDLPLRDWDEGIYANVARGMFRNGNWLYPTLYGQPYLNKPPLLEWLIASSYTVAGVSELSTRLPGTLVSALAVPLLYWVGRLVFVARSPALFSAAVYLTLLPAVRHGRLAMRDGISVTLLLLLLLCLLKARQDRRWALGVGGALGLLTLTKGILALLLGAIACLFLVVDGQLALLFSPYLWGGLFLGYAPVFAWYGAQFQHYGMTFLQVHFLSQAFSRVWQSVNQNAGPPWYYLLELLKYSWPWLVFLPGGLALAWKERQQTWSRLVFVGAIAYLGAISLMTTKLPWYILPLYPFLALSMGAYLAELWQHKAKYPKAILAFLALLAVVGLGGAVYGWMSAQIALVLIGIGLAIAMALAAALMSRADQRFIPVLWVGCYLVLGVLMASKLWLWELNEAYPVKPVAALIRSSTPAGTQVYTSFPAYRPSLNFYSDREVIPATAPDLQQRGATGSYLLIDQSLLPALPLPDSQPLGSAEGFVLLGPAAQR